MVNQNKNPQQAHSVTLDSAVVTGSLIAVALGVAVFAGFEYLLTPDVQFSEFISHHVLPGILVGIAVSVTISIVLRRRVITPVKAIFLHLHQMSLGRLTTLDIESSIAEIRMVVSGVNTLVDRLNAAPNDHALGDALGDLARLRVNLRGIVGKDGDRADRFVPIMRDLRALEADLLSVAQNIRSAG